MPHSELQEDEVAAGECLARHATPRQQTPLTHDELDACPDPHRQQQG